MFNVISVEIGTAMNDTERARLERRIEHATEVAEIGQVLGLVGPELGEEIDPLPDRDFDELAAEAHLVIAAGTVC